ncbi:MAG: DUF4105 domain-containing protein, partial [Desulforhopalus sp.]
MRKIRFFLVLIFILPLIGWGGMSLYYSGLPNFLPSVAAVGFILGSLIIFLLADTWKKAVAYFAVLFVLVLGAFFLKKPSNDRDWQPDLALLPHATIEDNRITIHNIRNSDYRSETDFTLQYYDKSFDLDTLSSVDLFLVDWGLKSLVHTMVSFGFDDRDYIAVSIEARKEQGEGYSTVQGFFRQYELTYVVADERDIIRLRTNYRQGETVYLYRIQGSKELFRQVFLDYLRSINQLKEKAEWYNALLTNCTTQLRG